METNKEFRALSWKEPFATLMMYGKIETRTWPTKYRGMVLICASKVPYSTDATLQIAGRTQHDEIIRIFLKHKHSVSEYCGKAIAVGELVDCRPMEPWDEWKCFVQYRPGLYCHIYKNVRPIKPFPYRGQQGWKRLKSKLLNHIIWK